MTRIIYVPGGPRVNCYDPGEDVVFLDEKLWQYPQLHQRIRDHELQHARNDDHRYGFINDLIQDLREDLFLHFSTSEEAEQAREYIKNNRAEANRSFPDLMITRLSNAFRALAVTVMRPLGFLYRRYS